MRISIRLVYGVLPDLSSEHAASSELTLVPPSPLARRIPLSQHPSTATPNPPEPYWLNQTVAEDPLYRERNKNKSRARAPIPGTDDRGLEWAAWIGHSDKADGPLEHAMLPFFADCMRNLPSLLPKELRPGPTYELSPFSFCLC